VDGGRKRRVWTGSAGPGRVGPLGSARARDPGRDYDDDPDYDDDDGNQTKLI